MNFPQAKSDNKPIIDDAAVLRIKRYIERKHPEFTTSQRAALFANAIHRIIDQHLPDFDEPVKVTLRRELLMRVGMERRFTLMTEHIVEACMKLDLEESGLTQLTFWMTKHQLAGLEEMTAQRPLEERSNHELYKYRKGLRKIGIVVLLIAQAAIASSRMQPDAIAHKNALSEDVVFSERLNQRPKVGLPGEYKYHALNGNKLKAWLQTKKSLLAEEPYFSAIVAAAEENDIHPLLLFAITGQEQAYVPKDRKQAKQIANNPFNVNNSWESYNTNIADSARIASQTIVNISQNRPADVDPIFWLNKKYAEDPNWWVGVSSIFMQMREEIERDNK